MEPVNKVEASLEKKAENGAVEKAAETLECSSLLPHLISIDRVLQLPIASYAWSSSNLMYGKVKG